VYCRVLGNDMIVLNSEDVVQDLLEKRSHNYSDRIHLPIREPYGFSQDMIFRKHDDTWRAHRRVAQQGLRADAVKTFQSIQRRCSLDLIRELANTPRAYLHHFEKLFRCILVRNPKTNYSIGSLRQLSYPPCMTTKSPMTMIPW